MNGVALAFSRAASVARAPATGSAPIPAAPSAFWMRDDRHLMLIGGMIWVLVVLMIVPEGFDYRSLTADEVPKTGGAISRLLWLALLGLGLIVIAWRAAFAWLVVRWLNPFLLAFIVLAVASVAWSMDPPLTVRRLIRVTTIFVAAMAFVLMGWHALRFQNVLRPIITVMLLGSIVFGVAWPNLAIHQDGADILIGAWHGLANHKNGLGDIACIGLIFWFHAWLSQQVRAGPALVGGALAVACLVLSRSSTSMVAAVFTLLFLAMLLRSPKTLNRYMPWLVVLFVAALLTYSLALLHVVPGLDMLLNPIGAITGKDMTLTGRTEIWDIMWEHIRLHPFLGTGYSAYWTVPAEGIPSYEFMLRLNFYPGTAHNGYLDILNDLGAVGLVVLLGYLANYVAQSLRLLQVDRVQASLYLALFLQQAIVNLSESRWFSVLSIDFVIMTLATTALARTLLEQRLRHYWGDPQRPAHAGATR